MTEFFIPPLGKLLAQELHVFEDKEEDIRMKVRCDFLESISNRGEEGRWKREVIWCRGEVGSEEVTLEELDFVKEESQGLNIARKLGVRADEWMNEEKRSVHRPSYMNDGTKTQTFCQWRDDQALARASSPKQSKWSSSR